MREEKKKSNLDIVSKHFTYAWHIVTFNEWIKKSE